MWLHCSLSAVQRQTNSEPFPDLILVFHAQGEIDWDCGFALESLPAKTGICILPRLSVFLWLRKQRPKIRARPAQGYFRMKDVDRRIEAIAQVNVESKNEKVERAEFNVPTCENRFFWMTNVMYSMELLMKLRRLLTWYFALRVGVRRHARKQCRF